MCLIYYQTLYKMWGEGIVYAISNNGINMHRILGLEKVPRVGLFAH